MKRGIWLALFLCVAFLAGCRQAPAAETEAPPPTPTITPSLAPAPTPEPKMDLPALEPWQEAYIQLLQEDNRKIRAAAREAERGAYSVEEFYAVCDADKDGTPELLVEYWEQGRYFIDLYTFRVEEPALAGTFYSGRIASHLYVHPEEAGLWSEAVRAEPYGENHWWRKFTLTDGSLQEEELLDERIEWEGEGAFAVLAHDPVQAEVLVPGAQEVPMDPIPAGEGELRLILDYVPPLTSWQAVAPENIENAFWSTDGEEAS